MKQKLITGIIILITFLFLFAVINGSKNNPTANPTVTEELSSDVNIFYWGEACPHCHDTIDWMEENKIEQQIKVVRKEIYENQVNAKELIQNAKICGIDENSIGVPFMFTSDQRCLVGTPDITSYLTDEINKLIQK